MIGLDVLIQSLLSGVFMGSVYALVAIGFTLVFGVTDIVNFAHGHLVMGAMFVTYLLFKAARIDPYANHVLATTSWSADADIKGLKQLAGKYQGRFKEPMDSTAAGGFTAFSVIWDALERARSTDRKKLRDAVAATQMKTGDRMYMQLRGCKFAPNGENLLAGRLVFTIRDKEWITVAPKELAKASAVYPKPRWGG